MGKIFDRTKEDLANFVGLEHTNIRVPDQRIATIFYIVGMGFTRDPYMVPGVNNMWINIGRTQIHLPTGKPQIIPGHTGILIPDLQSLRKRLDSVKSDLQGTSFNYTASRNKVDVTCPWGNKYRCILPSRQFGRELLGIRYVEFDCLLGVSKRIGRFYREIMGANATIKKRRGATAAHVEAGHNQWIIFRETETKIPQFDGHHLQVYLSNFSKPYLELSKRGLISEESNQYQYRFRNIVDVESGKKLHKLEHEIRSMTHPLFRRPMINRNPEQNNNNYALGHSDRVFVLKGEKLR